MPLPGVTVSIWQVNSSLGACEDASSFPGNNQISCSVPCLLSGIIFDDVKAKNGKFMFENLGISSSCLVSLST